MARFSCFFTTARFGLSLRTRTSPRCRTGPEDLLQAKEQVSQYARELETRVEERTADLRQSIQSLEGFLYHVAHDLRAPLRAVEGLIALLIRNHAPDFDDTGRDYARRAAAAATRMDQLIQDLLEYGRVSKMDVPVVDVDLGPPLEQVFAQLAGTIQASRAQIQVDRPLPPVSARQNMLETVFHNLIENALKFVAPGVAPRIHIWAESEESLVRVWMEDNGIGIEPEHQERVFRVFERLETEEESFRGTGIGLAIVAKVMERMRGRVGVHSQPGTGSRFWLEFPKATGRK